MIKKSLKIALFLCILSPSFIAHAELSAPSVSTIVKKSMYSLKRLLAREKKVAPSEKKKQNVAAIIIEGPINSALAKKIVPAISEMAKDDAIDAVLFVVDSGGGNAGVANVIHDEIKHLKEKKPAGVFVVDYCCSAAYMIACAADFIVAPQIATTGSIGIIGEFVKFNDDEQKIRINNVKGKGRVEVITAGKFKAPGSPYRQLTEDERESIKEEIQEAYQIFITLVAQARNLSLENASEWAEGKTFFSPKALDLGLIDYIGSWTDAQAKILELLKNKKPDLTAELEDIEVTYYSLNSEQ